MKSLRIQPLARATHARVDVPGSKSYTLRALLVAAMTPGPVRLTGALVSDDTEAMLRCLNTLGIKTVLNGADIEVIGDVGDVTSKAYALDAGLSGLTMRFMLALACVIPGQQTITGGPGLEHRPIGKLVDALGGLGAHVEYLEKPGYPPLRVTSGVLYSGEVELDGSESSQYLSALLMIAPAVGGFGIEVKGRLGSKPYVDMTIDVMKAFGVKVQAHDHRSFRIAAQAYRADEYRIEGDFSSACYFFAIAALTGSAITVGNLEPDSLQADAGFLKLLERAGCKVTRGKDSVTVTGKGLKPLDADMSDCPDQAQTLAVLAAFAKGKTTITGVRSLRVKETERVKALEEELHKMGIKVVATTDKLTVHGGEPVPAAIETYGDHRMAMAFAVAGAKLPGMKIQNPGVVTKTFPDFWQRLAQIGIKTEEVQPNIVLIGMRGTGKTTIARVLAKKLGIRHLDLDEIMTLKLSLSTPEIVEQYGWGYFRDQEAAIAKEISEMNNVLISTGGGIVLRPDNIEALRKNGVFVLLKASVDVMVRRLGGSQNRPRLTDKRNLRAEIQQVLRERQRLYEAAADIVIDTDKLKPGQAADAIIAKLGRSRP